MKTLKKEREPQLGPRRKMGNSMAQRPKRPQSGKGPQTMADIDRMLRYIFNK
jgi:hypothetical protein